MALANATEFKISTDNADIDFGNVDKNISITIEKQDAIKKQFSESNTKTERNETIDEILKLGQKEFESLDLEIFYQDLIHYNNQKLKNKYSFLSDKTIKRLKLALEIK